jgi:phosphohistidine phosphatase SixA
MRIFLRLIVPAILLTQIATAQQQTRTVYLVRHAEATSSAPDAPLTPAGEKRADCLAKMMKEAGIKQIYVTDMKRTQQTAAPLAKALGMAPKVIPAKDPNQLIQDLLYAGGGNILVVGHSDTLPFILARMKAGAVNIGANDFDRMFVTTVIEGGSTQASTLHYCDCGGAPGAAMATPAPSPKKKGPTTKK